MVVAGYGWCGKGVAMRAKGMGAHVIVTEIDPVKSIEAVMDGFKVMKMKEAAKIGDVFITVTGCKDVITYEIMKSINDGAILCNAGHFNVEIAMKDLENNAVEISEEKKNINGYKLPNNKWIYVLAEGRLVNLAAGDGHPIEIMDMSFAIQALSAEFLVNNRGQLENNVIAVPNEIDNSVARRKLGHWNIVIDKLTYEQEKYLHS